jgi:predicted ABC-type ATPase
VARPFILVLAGVNGAGKSSVGGALLQQHGLTWFNPDTYARELMGELGVAQTEANARAWAYGRSALEAAIATRSNYAFETTLGGRTISRLLGAAAKTHSVGMLYCGLSSPEMHMARVAQRVAHGGHPIPEQKIRERWDASRINLIGLLPSLAQLQVFDNSANAPAGRPIPDPVLVLHVEGARVLVPSADDVAALASVPSWARPIAEAALRLAKAKRRPRP